MSKVYYHGSALAGIQVLEPRSVLHGTGEKVAYLTDQIPYALLYIWDAKHNERTGKYVTAWIQDGITFYEEQFPNQLQTFYAGVTGYLYSLQETAEVQPMAGRESLYYVPQNIQVTGTETVADVHHALLAYEASGLLKVLRYTEQTQKRQAELTGMIAEAIRRKNFCKGDEAEIRFMKKHFAAAWAQAESTIENQPLG